MRRSKARRVVFECLEDRALLSAVPYGAAPDDLGEFMLGDVLVTVVLMESNDDINISNPNTEDWTVGTIEEVQRKVVEGLTWWQDTLAEEFPGTPHTLNFQYDWTYAGGEFQDANLQDVVLTDYEPIANKSNDFSEWIYDFLDLVGYNSTDNFSNDIRAFNHAQRQTYNTDWAFTIFVANDENDADGWFKSGGSFRRAFSFAGGQFIVSPAGRPASTFAHETGHMFWARDEYAGGGSYTDHRGYYDTNNLNAADNPAPGFVQADSLMATGTLLSNAYVSHTSSAPSLEMIGWRDTDNDGIFDLLDVPLTLTGSGFVDPQSQQPQYRFVGSSSVRTLMNQNSSGLQNDITINEVSRAEYRIDGGSWQTVATFDANTYTAELNFSVPLSDWAFHSVDIRTIDDDSGITSPAFQGNTTTASSVLEQGIYGFVWNDQDDNGQFDPGESGLPDWTIRMVDAEGEPLETDAVEPDDYTSKLDNLTSKVTLSALGIGLDGSVYAATSGLASTGAKVFGYDDANHGPGKSWTSESRQLRMDFDSPVTSVSLDAVADIDSDYARLEAYNAGGQLLGRYTTGQLGIGNFETMTVSRSTPDIAYAIAHAHGYPRDDGEKPEVRFDNLRFGPETTTLTDDAGAYSLTNLAAGTYHVQAVAPGSDDPLTQQHDVALAAEGEAVGSINFDGQTASWKNPGNPSDVNDDGIVTPLDALVLINYINAHLTDLSVPAPPAEPGPYYDVDGNGSVTALDVLIVIDVLNAIAAGEPSSEPMQGAGGSAEGEYTPANPASIPHLSDRPETQARDEYKPIIGMPLLGTDDLNEPHFHSESLGSATPLDNAEPADQSDLWRTAADSYFQQIDSAVDERSTAAIHSYDPDAGLDEILPEIAVEVTKLSDAFAALKA